MELFPATVGLSLAAHIVLTQTFPRHTPVCSIGKILMQSSHKMHVVSEYVGKKCQCPLKRVQTYKTVVPVTLNSHGYNLCRFWLNNRVLHPCRKGNLMFSFSGSSIAILLILTFFHGH